MGEKITLRKKLLLDGELNRNILVSSNFIKDLEVYGYMNCQDRRKILSGQFPIRQIPSGQNDSNSDLEGDVQINSPEDWNIYSFFIRQKNVVSPVYHTISVCPKDIDIDVEELCIPSLCDNKLYKEIKIRYGRVKKITSDYEWEKNRFPSEFSLVEGKVMMHLKQGNVVFKDNYDSIKSVEEYAIALCRYPLGETGEMKYVFFALDQLFYDEKSKKSSTK